MGFVFFGLVVAYNPLYIWYLMSHAALGGMTLRMIASSMFLTGFCVFSFAAVLLCRNGKITVKRTPIYFLTNILLAFYALAIIIGFIRGNDLKYMLLDSFPLLEMFVIYYLIKFSPLVEKTLNFKRILKWLLVYFFIMAATDLVSYGVLSLVAPAYFGALRALIGGVTVNRLMDYVLPLFLSLCLVSYEHVYRRRWVMVLFCMSVVVVMLTFYRTLYLAVFAGLLYLVLSTRERFIFIFRIAAAIALVSILLLFGARLFVKNNTCNLPVLFTQRVVSIYSPDKKIDYSGTSRIAHNKDMVYSIVTSFPDIAGVGGIYVSREGDLTPIFCTSNFFLQLFLLLGVPAGLLFIGIYCQAVGVARRLARDAKDTAEKAFFAASAAVLVSLAVVLCLFPYVGYFPLLYVFGAILGCVDKKNESVSVNL